MMKFEFYKDTLREVLETLITWDGIESLKIEKYASGWKVVGNDYDNDVEYSGNDLDKIARKVQADVVKRNKQVDVPTEAWQKSVDRKLEYANNTIVPLIAYLSAHHDFDISKFNEWKKEYIDAIKE